MAKRTIVFYEVNEAPTSHFPSVTDCEGQVFDVINNEGATTLRVLELRLPDYSKSQIQQALNVLRDANVIGRRTMSAEEGD